MRLLISNRSKRYKKYYKRNKIKSWEYDRNIMTITINYDLR